MTPLEWEQAVEDRARELARENGENPDAVVWEGDLAVPYGTRSWPAWHDYAVQAREELLAEEDEEDER